jgi:hypothetical protein
LLKGSRGGGGEAPDADEECAGGAAKFEGEGNAKKSLWVGRRGEQWMRG